MPDLNSAVHIVYAADDKFAEILGVSLVSLLENSREEAEIQIYVLDSGISEENREKLEAVCQNYGRSAPVFIAARDISRELGMQVQADRGSLSQYARLFVSSNLPEDLERVLYLDCDILLNQSVGQLWNLDLQGKTIGALMDAFSSLYRANIDLKPEDVMFNSGVMLIDLKRWKEKKVEGKLLNFIASRYGKIQQGDQGALNAVLSEDTFCFHPKFNSLTIFYDFTYPEMLQYRKPPVFYEENEVAEAVEAPVVIHFTSSFLSSRPWMKGCAHRYAPLWLRYKAISPWKDAPLWEAKSRSKTEALYVGLVKKLPRALAIFLSGLLQAYGRPLLYRLKN